MSPGRMAASVLNSNSLMKRNGIPEISKTMANSLPMSGGNLIEQSKNSASSLVKRCPDVSIMSDIVYFRTIKIKVLDKT